MMGLTATPRFDLPTVEPETQAFWEAAQRGQLLIARCSDCGRVHYYPRTHCVFCWSEKVEHIPANGIGTLYTYSTVFINDLPPFNERVPYVAAQVDLEEGVRVTTNIVDCPREILRIGMAVRLRFRVIADGVAIPVFVPA
jgi:uncharacterized OB-fold protein